MRVTLETPTLRAQILPDLGAGLAALELHGPDGWHPVLRRAPERVTWFNDLACYFLAPWSNRIPSGRYTWRGREHHVPTDWPDGSAIHGLVKDKPWSIIQRCPLSATLEFQSYAARYELVDNALRVRLDVRNSMSEPIPVGLGFHPFFPRQLWDKRDEVAVHYHARGRYPAQAMIPTAPARLDDITEHLSAGRALGALALDDVFAGSPDNATITWPASRVRIRYACSPNLAHAVLYTREPAFFCFEPVTMVNDGFNLHTRGWKGTGVVELAPGQDMTADWTLRIERT